MHGVNKRPLQMGLPLITLNSEYPDLVTDLLLLAQEELEHFHKVLVVQFYSVFLNPQ